MEEELERTRGEVKRGPVLVSDLCFPLLHASSLVILSTFIISKYLFIPIYVIVSLLG
jgi:hypothetical protein